MALMDFYKIKSAPKSNISRFSFVNSVKRSVPKTALKLFRTMDKFNVSLLPHFIDAIMFMSRKRFMCIVYCVMQPVYGPSRMKTRLHYL